MISRSKHSISNILYGAINRVVGILLPFILRTIIIKVLGEEYLGINNLFASVLQVLNFAELGIGSAIAANMYKPIAENDRETLSALLNFYRKWYRIIGIFIIISGLIILPFIPKLINGGTPPDVNIYVLFLLYISQTSFSYLFWAYKTTLISAHQRMDVVEKVGAICKLLTFILQILAICILKDITLYVVANVLCIILNNILCKYIADRDYPYCKCEGTLDNSIKNIIKKNIFALAIQKLGLTISGSLGNIVVSTYLGLSAVAVYGNYYYIISAVGAFVMLIYSSITASVGNCIAVESADKNYNDFSHFSFLNLWIIGWCSICLICLYQPFMKIWMGERLMLSFINVFFFVLCFYAQNIRRVCITYKDAAGMWYADKYKPLVGCVVNLIVTFMLIKDYGILAILIALIIDNLLIEYPWETYVLFKIYFKKKKMQYYKNIATDTILLSGVGILTYLICLIIPDNVYSFIVKLLICFILPNILIYFVFNKKNEFIESKIIISNIFQIIKKK